MKKEISMLLCGTMIAGMLAGCGAGSGGSSGTSAASESTPAVSVSETSAAADSSTGGKHKVGYNYLGAGAYSLATLANNEKKVSDIAGQDSIGVDDQFSVEQIVSDIENMINSGCDGVDAWLVSDALCQQVSTLCGDNKVYFALSDKVASDENVIKTLKANKYFAGACGPANDVYGSQLAQYALDQGWKTCIITSSSAGDATDTPRLEAFKKTFEAGGGTIVDELHADQQQDALPQLQDSLTANGEVDVIYGTGSDYGVYACTALEDHPDWKTKVITSGLDEAALKLLNDKSSAMAMVTGDYWISGFFSAIFLQNALEGNVLRDSDGSAIWIDDLQPFEVTSEKYELYKKYFLDEFPYTDEEIKAMIGISYDDMVKIVKDYSLDNRLMAKYKAGIISKDEMTAAGYDV